MLPGHWSFSLAVICYCTVLIRIISYCMSDLSAIIIEKQHLPGAFFHVLYIHRLKGKTTLMVIHLEVCAMHM